MIACGVASLLPALVVPLLCFAVSSAGAAVSSNSSAAPTNSIIATLPLLQIVTCREDANLDALIAEFKLSPEFIYRFLPGFAAPMDTATIQDLKSDPRVLFVEADGPVSLC